MACTECHAAKVKCDRELPCSRCVRLSRVCVKHQSKQGQRSGSSENAGRKRQRRAVSLGSNSANKPQDGLMASEDGALTHELEMSSLKPDNYGLNFLIRSWVSIAFTRRSFSLLSRAASLASRCGISMDQIMCETKGQRGMDFLYPILLTPATEQRVLGKPLQYSEVPKSLWKAIGLLPPELETNDIAQEPDLTQLMGERWLWIREMKKGVSRYLCSPAFERDVVSMPLVEATYEANKLAVVDLFLDATDRDKQIRGFAQQILSVHTEKDAVPRLTRLRGIKLKCNFSATPVDVDQINCLALADVDHGFLSWEYIRLQPENGESSSKVPSPEKASPLRAASFTYNSQNPPAFDSDMMNVDDLDDKDLEYIFDLLK